MPKHNTFKFLYKTHIYAGLFCSVFLIIMAISGLDFQHHFFDYNAKSKKVYKKEIHYNGDLCADSLATTVKDSLDEFGIIQWWDFKEDSLGNFSFKISRPGRFFLVELNRKESTVLVTEARLGLGSTLDGLHEGVRGSTNFWILNLWAIYGQSATVLLVFVIITSIYLWFKKSVKSKTEWAIIITAVLLSIFLIIYIWLIG